MWLVQLDNAHFIVSISRLNLWKYEGSVLYNESVLANHIFTNVAIVTSYTIKIWFSISKKCISTLRTNDACIRQPISPGARFTNVFSIAIQIRWKYRFTLTSILIQWSLQKFVHGTTAVLSWHVQKIVAIRWPATELWQGKVSIEFELRANNR